MKTLTQLFSIAILVLFLTDTAFPQSAELPEGVSIYQLDNGIQVLMIEKPTLPMVGINTVVKVGSAYESFATSGMSHMLEHLLFNGTSTMTQKELYDATDRIGGYNNANTSEYYTNFMMVTPAENIKEGMKIQAAMLFDSVLPEEKFEKEKGIVLEEIAKTLANPSEQASRNTLSVIFKGHALSLPTLGTYETIKHMNRDEVYDFYKNYYVPNNMIISVIGNFNSAEMLKTLEEIYGKEKPGDVIYPQNGTLAAGFEPLPENHIEGKIFHRFYSGKSLRADVLFPIPPSKRSELFDLIVKNLDDKSDEFKKKLNDKFDGAIEDISFGSSRYPAAAYLQATLTFANDDAAGNAIAEFIAMMKKTKPEITKEEAETEAVKARTRFLKNTEKPHMFGIFNADLLAEEGIEAILDSYSGEGYLKAFRESKNCGFGSRRPVVIIQHPESEASAKENSDSLTPVLFDNGENGAVVIAKENPGSDLLAIHYLLKYKSAYESEFGKDAALILHSAFGDRMKSDKVAKKSMKFGFTFTVKDNPWIPMDNIYLSPAFGYIRAEGLGDDIEGAIKFLNEQMLDFKPTKEEFEKALGEVNHGGMMGRHGNAAKKKYVSVRDSLLYEKPEFGKPEKEITYENLLKFAKIYFTPSNIIVSVVSKEKPEIINSYFADFSKVKPAGAMTGKGYYKKFRTISSSTKVEIDGGGEQAYLYYGFQKNISPEEKAALKALSLLLSDKIVFDVREKQGMAYRMSAGIETIDDKAMFYIDMGTRPENVGKLVPQFEGFFNSDFANEITEDELKRAINMYLGRMMFRRLSSVNQAYYLGHSYYFHGDINYDGKFLEDLKNVSVDAVKATAGKYLHPENEVYVIVK
ncbi:MAG: insulinase family protein [Chlorobi bacterium]|nr:insulinase family protein [Chlorobiota bacterium]